MVRRELYTFLTVAEQGSFLKASRELFLTPAAVMHQIDKLEADLDCALFQRSSQGVRLTPAGQSFRQDVKELVRAGDQAVWRAKRVAQAQRPVIRVGTSLLRPCKALTDLWSRPEAPPFQLELVSFDVDTDGTVAMLTALDSSIDCFVSPCASLRWKREYVVQPLYWEPSCIALPRTHPLAKKASLTWADLEGETLLLAERGKSTELDRLRDEIAARHSTVRVLDIQPVSNMEPFNLCNRMGCLMELPESWADIHPALVTLPMEWDYAVEYGVLCAKDPRPAVAEFLRWLETQFPQGEGAQ